MRKIIDAHLHIDRFAEEPGPSFDFFHPPKALIVADEILAKMDEQGVESGVIMQHPNGPLNEEIAKIVRENPTRFRGSMILPLDAEDALAKMEMNREKGLTVIKLEMFGTTMLYPGLKLDSDRMLRIFEKAEELGLTVAIDPFRIGMAGYQHEELRSVIGRFSGLRFVICHLGYPMSGTMDSADAENEWHKMLSLAEYKNVWIDFSAMPDMLCSVEAYPYPSATKLVRDFIDQYGAGKAMWGSDIPGELNRGTYGQLIDMYDGDEKFADEERELIFYRNAKHVYFE